VRENTAYHFDASVSSAVEGFADGATPPTQQRPVEGPLSDDVLGRMQRYWQAANYLTIGQIYL
jgi:xylulose-5-phosphate/fructose-6-phosphate phosphoketolase